MREEMQNLFAGPPGLVVVKRVFRKSAHVDDAVLRADVRPSVGRGFTAIIEAGPHKPTGKPRARIAEAPPTLSRCAAGGGVRIVGTDITLFKVSDVDAARAYGTHGFCADYRLFRVLLVIRLGSWIHVVVAHDIALHKAADPNGANRRDGYGAGTVVLHRRGFHGGKNVQADRCI